MDHKNQLSVFV